MFSHFYNIINKTFSISIKKYFLSQLKDTFNYLILWKKGKNKIQLQYKNEFCTGNIFLFCFFFFLYQSGSTTNKGQCLISKSLESGRVSSGFYFVSGSLAGNSATHTLLYSPNHPHFPHSLTHSLAHIIPIPSVYILPTLVSLYQFSSLVTPPYGFSSYYQFLISSHNCLICFPRKYTHRLIADTLFHLLNFITVILKALCSKKLIVFTLLKFTVMNKY